MPREDKEAEEERRAKDAYELMRIRLDRLEKNIDKLAAVPPRRETPKPKPPPEFIRNVVGSSAAAGSAEFHIFRNNRRREMSRLDYIEKEAQKEEEDKEYARILRERLEAAEAKTAKKRAKRLKQKEKLKNAKKLKKNKNKSESSSSSSGTESEENANTKNE